MKRIVQLIPYDGIGGVEVAARSLPTGRHGDLIFERQYLVQAPGTSVAAGEYCGPQISQNNLRAYWHAIWRLYRDPPDLLVASLWRCALILIFLKMLRPHTKAVIFLHSDQDVHFVDKVSNRLAMYFSNAIWTDSRATVQRRVPPKLQDKTQIVSFLLNRRSLPKQQDPVPEFIFWGRLNTQKGLDRALKLFATIVQRRNDARLKIIGPDGGMENYLRAQVAKLGLRDCVVFKGSMRQKDITIEASGASFYLQTSLYEGMAMSVVEAMQDGLVPVVTPVGEIAHYCDDGKSAIFIHDDDSAVDDVMSLLLDTARYRRISRAAAEYWQFRPLYREEFIAAAKKILG